MENMREEQYPSEWMDNVSRLGRVFVYNGIMWLSWSGTGIEWECDGAFSLYIKADKVVLDGPEGDIHAARYALYMDGALQIDGRLETSEKSICMHEEGKHVYRFIKLSESADSSLGLVLLEDEEGGCAHIKPSARRKLKIEMIGDSITCGYGVEGSLGQTYTTATENVTGSYSYMVAQRLNADYSIISKSGAGMISGYTDTGERNPANIITDHYDKMGCSMFPVENEDPKYPSDFEYDFSFEPDIIILNIGTNDMSYCAPDKVLNNTSFKEEELDGRRREFCSAYKAFIGHLRKKNPFAKIICTLGVMGEYLNKIVEMAVSMQVAEGDRRIYWLPLKDQDPANGYGTDYHPSPKTQELLVDAVTDFVEKVIGNEV